MIKIKVEHSFVINLPPEEIFSHICDLENLVDWSSAVIAARKISPGTMQAGSRVRGTIRFIGRWSDISFEIVECKPGRYLTIKSIAGVAPCLFSYRFEPVEGDGTNVFLQTMIHLTGDVLGLSEPVVTSMVRRQIEHDLLTLKDMLEAGALICRSTG